MGGVGVGRRSVIFFICLLFQFRKPRSVFTGQSEVGGWLRNVWRSLGTWRLLEV